MYGLHYLCILCVFYLPSSVWGTGFTSFYNDRYGDLGINYDSVDAVNGIWGLDATAPYTDIQAGTTTADTVYTGCSYDDTNFILSNCVGPTVYLDLLSIVNITRGALNSTVTSLTIQNCASFELFETGTFDSLTSLSYIKIQGTALNHVPDLSNTIVETLNMVGNAISIDTNTHSSWTMPSTIKYIALMENQIYWIPPGMVSGPNLRMASFGDNRLPQINQNIFGDTSALIYFGAEGNLITRISKNTLAPLANENFKHLNLSNNLLSFVQPETFRQLPNLTVLELHGNSFTTVYYDVFYDMPNLAHLDLHRNAIANLPSKSFLNLPMLRELRLHSQTNPLVSIAYDAWKNISPELKYLYVSDNGLTTFPHQVMGEESYPNLLVIHADTCSIGNMTEYGAEAFLVSQRYLYTSKSLTFTPFSTYPNLHTLHISNNQIEYINSSDLCNMTSLQYLYIQGNRIREAYMDVDCFACLANLIYMNIGWNNIQYVPDAMRSSTVLPALQTLYMRGNKLTFLEQFAFSNVTTLTLLDVSQNRIVAIENGAFPPQIQTLNISTNDFRFFHENPFTNLSSLTSLSLYANNIQYIPDSAFHGCTSLTRLALETNNIPQLLSTHFRDCPLSTELNAGYNDIGYIEQGTFSQSNYGNIILSNNKITSLPATDFNGVTMSNLLLGNNRINYLPYQIFKDLTVTDTLDLSNNYITSIESYAFDNININTLTLSSNTIRYLSSYAFNSVTLSADFYLQSTYITNIPTRAFNSVSATNIHMDQGQIATIEREAFYDLTVTDMFLNDNALTLIDVPIFGGTSVVGDEMQLSNNQIQAMSSDAFNNVDLRRIYLNSNQLNIFPECLINQTLVNINLGQNQITEIPPGALSGQTGLYTLTLSDNLLTTISAGLFDDLTALRNLYLARNSLTDIPTGLFTNLGSIRNLFLNRNSLTHFEALGGTHNSLAQLNLLNNDIETISYLAFSSLTALTSLTLNGNNLECSCQLIETIHAVTDAVSSGTCSSPAATSGASLVSGAYANATSFNASDFQCTASNISGTLISSKDFSITWIKPALQFYATDPAESPTPLVGNVIYEITCTTTTGASTLTKTETDTITANTTDPVSYTVTFLEADGVVAGTTYTCSITMALNGYTSGKSEPAVLTTADDIATPVTPGPDDLVLEVIYHDFSRYHADFRDISYPTYSNPTYVASPYGAWLSTSTTPTADTFSTWFRHDYIGSTNQQINDSLILVDQADSSKLYWSDAFFPVDGKGYTSESQQDCAGTYRNFGFTSAIRAGLVYAGTEIITLAGGEALWLYINKVKLVEFLEDGSTTSNCFVLDLSTATSPGGSVTPQIGTLSSGTCASLASSGSSISLALEVGVTYHFDLFHAETRLCSSEFLLHLQGTTLSQDFSTYAPLDYDVSIPEDMEENDIVATINLMDDFSVGSYSLNIDSGNTNMEFMIEDSTYTFTSAAVSPTYTNMTDISGNAFAFVDCSSTPAVPSAKPVISSFAVTTTSAIIRLNNVLDYEAVTSYLLRITVTDVGIPLTGSIAVRILIQDANDNCPTISPASMTLSPEPVLQLAAIGTFTTSDVDSGENANVYFIVSAITEDPLVDFNDTYDLWGDVYLRYTSLNFTVVAIDNGTIPRGAMATVSVNVSNTCVMDVLFGKISYTFSVDAATGEMVLRVPKYYMFDFTCTDNIGLISGHVLDNMLSASTSVDYLSGPGRARLNQTEDPYSYMVGGWVADVTDINQYIEVDMNMTYKFTQLFLQGRADADQWVTSFKILYYNSATNSWDTYTDAGGSDTFTGNTDRTTVVTYDLDPAIFSQKVRINPQTWNGAISLRFEMSGCPEAEQIYYDVSCQRCETSYYCEGDGVRKMCGRCENTSVTCDRNPVEHSYGLASECTTCPAGRICANGTAYICEDNHYVECTNTSCPSACTQCEAGYACKDGIRTICEAGKYSDGTAERCTSCLEGTYQNQTGQSSCLPCESGYYSVTGMTQCNVCSPDRYSDNAGSGCVVCTDVTECPCLNTATCHSENLCYNKGSGTYGCLPCSDGLTGDGQTCTDIDECTLYNPCFMSRCINTDPGFQCLECPDGYTGTYEDALAYSVKYHRVFLYMNNVLSNLTYQTCDDIDECATNNGGCDPLMTCVNTVGSYYCDFCATGYMGTNRTGCYLDDFCASGVHTCDTTTADCVYLGPAQFRCECKPGYAGTGTLCGIDTDMDGRPDRGLSCTDNRCGRDNCISVPNSNQEDTDGDYTGNNCDADDDNDGRYDYLDNCQYVSNWDQLDTNSDGVGDVCTVDTDGDGVADEIDNCPTVSNSAQTDSDSDTVGDGCDNCPSTSNVNQDDVNGNGVGDACESVTLTNIDEDGDGILDSVDNCPSYMNGDQADTDSDGIGDLCDSDIDGDGVNNDVDNCDYYSNSDQADADGNNVGDICETDADSDSVPDATDTCPHNPARSSTSFSNYFTILLDPSSTSTSPSWHVKSNGGEVEQTVSTDMPIMLIDGDYTTVSPDATCLHVDPASTQTEHYSRKCCLKISEGTDTYGSVEYAGTWYTSATTATDYIGFVFAYQSSRKFYLVTWKGQHYNYKDLSDSTYKAGIQGPQIKLVDSTLGPSTTLTNAIWHSDDTTDHVTVLWQDPSMTAWSPATPYRWYLTHRATTGYINLKIYQGTSLLIDSGSLYDYTLSGGRLGVFQFGAFPMIWSYLEAKCLDHTNNGLYLDGVDDQVTLSDVATLHMDKSFTIEAWIKLDAGYTSGPYPIVCTADENLCFTVEGGVLKGKYADVTVTGSSSLTAGTWHSVVFKHSISLQSITLFLDGTLDTQVSVTSIFNWTSVATADQTMYIGKGGNSSYFRGTIDEVRFYSVAILDAELTSHISLPSLQREVLKYYGAVHFRMEEAASATSLTNSGYLSSTSAQLSGGTFVTSYQQYNQFQIAFPNN